MPTAVKSDAEYYFELFKGSFIEFTKFFMKDELVKKIPPFHEELYDMLPKSLRLALATPRGHGKTTIVSKFYPLWLALFGKRKDILIISNSDTLAIEWLRKVKIELESNQKILGLFGDLRSDKWTENHLMLRPSKIVPYYVNIRARGAGGQIRGFRPDCIICDDIETDETVESEEQRKKLKNWLFKACLNTLLPEGQFIIIGTIIHPLSVLNDLLSSNNGWTKKKYQAYREGRQEAGFELWADLWSHELLQARKKEIGSWAFASEYMNDPMTDETAPIKEHMLHQWTSLPTQYNCVIAVDPAYSEDDSADYKVAVLIATDEKMNRYLVSYIRTHEPSLAFIDGILNLYLQNRGYILNVGIPDGGGGDKEFFTSFLNRALERKISVPTTALKNTFTTVSGEAKRSKKARVIAALQPLFESGKYFINESHFEARDELLTIGNSRWDDLVDAMAYAEQIIQPAYYETGFPSERVHYEPVKVMANYGMD